MTMRAGPDMSTLERLRSAAGKRFAVENDRTLTIESLMHFALSTGNLDPLYFDQDYAQQSARGRLVPPPTWYTQIADPHVGCQALYTRLALDAVRYTGEAPIPAAPGDSGPPLYFLNGLRSFDGGIGFRYLVPPRLGEPFGLSGEVTDVVSKESTRLGQFAVVKGALEYRGAGEDVLVHGFASSLVYELGDVPAGQAEPARHDESPVPAVPPVEALEGVRRRGRVPRFWEDVTEGEPIDTLFKGTLDHAEIAVHSLQYGQHCRADAAIREAWQLLRGGDGITAAARYRDVALDPEFRFGVARHLDIEEATSEGAPGAYDIGTQRAAWVAQVVTDWMGDAGEVAAFAVEIRGFVVVGDSVWCKGTVAEKYQRDGRHLARLELLVENQRAERVAVGSAEVCLPARAVN